MATKTIGSNPGALPGIIENAKIERQIISQQAARTRHNLEKKMFGQTLEQINEYRLFNEWRGRTLFGESLTDAVIRAKTLQRPDKFEGGVKVANGDLIIIKGVVKIRDTSNSNRGNKAFESVVVEADDGQYIQVDAELIV